jgi:hypothetical protein
MELRSLNLSDDIHCGHPETPAFEKRSSGKLPEDSGVDPDQHCNVKVAYTQPAQQTLGVLGAVSHWELSGTLVLLAT